MGLATQLATVDAPGILRQMFGSTILPRAAEVHVDVGVVAIAFALAALTTLLFGLLPAWQLSRSRTLTLVGPGVQGGGPTTSTTRSVLVVSQLALATVLLVAAGLLVNSFTRLMTNGKGYDASNVVALQAIFPNEYPVARKAETVAALLQRLRQLPGVQAAGLARHGLLIGEVITLGRFETAATRKDPFRPRTRAVSDGFLTAMGVPLIDGRDLRPADDTGAPPVVVVNRSAAMRLFGTTRAVGQPVTWFVADVPVALQVVGVFEDVRQESLADETAPEVFVDYRQLLKILSVRPDIAPRANVLAMGFPSFAIRTEGTPVSAIPAIQRLVSTVDPNVAIDAIVPMTALVADSVARDRFAAVLLGVLAITAAMLASIGVYGVLTYLVALRTSEIGVRMALGAQRGQVLALVLRTRLVLTSVGLTLGLMGAATMARLLRGILFGITPFDPLTFVAVAVLFGLVAAAASYVPARRAAVIDPLVALRRE